MYFKLNIFCVNISAINCFQEQVNNILNKENKNNHKGKSSHVEEKLKDKTMQKVKEATLRHLKSIGVNIPLLEDCSNFQR